MDAGIALRVLAAGHPQVWYFLLPLYVALIAFVIAIFVFRSRREKSRSARLQEMARQLDFDFLPTGDAQWQAEISSHALALFGRGSRRRLVNMIRGESQNMTVAIFDYSYVVQSGEHRNVKRQSVMALHSAALELPSFLLTPKTLMLKIGSLLGSKKIAFENRPRFAKSYVLRGDDADAIRQCFSNAVLTLFEQNLGWQAEADGPYLLLFRPGKRLPAAEIPGLLEMGLTVLSHFRTAVKSAE